MTQHWCEQYIGTQWEKLGNGPDTFDCYGLVRFVQSKHFGIEMAEIQGDATRAIATRKVFKNHMEHDNWVRVDKPQEGDCVEMGEGKYTDHIGIWVDVDGGGVLHCVQGAGTVFSKSNVVGSTWTLMVFWRAK